MSYKVLGRFVERTITLPLTNLAADTAVPAFIGYTEKAQGAVPDDLILKPTRISSLVEYEKLFGLPLREEKITVAITLTTIAGTAIEQVVAGLREADRSKQVMHYALQLYFGNGGGPCYIVSVGRYKGLTDALIEVELEEGLTAIELEDEPTLVVFPDAQNLSITDFRKLMDRALAPCATQMNRFVIMDVHGGAISMADPQANLLAGIKEFREQGVGSANLKYGAAYAPNIETVVNFAYDEARTMVTITTNGVSAAPVALDGLKATHPERHARAQAAIRDLACNLPPSPTVAATYSTTDTNRGVWKAPANIALKGVIKPVIPIVNSEQDQMNSDTVGGKSVNAVRLFTGKGTLVWGARTLSGNDSEWRYVSVRRLYNFIEKSVTKATAPFVFGPNDANSWATVQGMIENFLTTLWQQGALQGAKPEHAFYVSIGLGKTMTAVDIQQGWMFVEIGLAAVRPAEFIILRVSHKMARP